jgi:DNA-binding transcriptional LysR family regulator
MRALVGRGLGYAVLLQRQRHNLTLDGHEVRCLELDPPVDPIRVFLAITPAALRTRRGKAFLDFARETYRNPPEWMGLVPAPEPTAR